ncbi:MAG: hypothetical protein Q8R13_06400, partial [bacterium]|nr:hypothetical protein [bacterium]
TEYLWMPLLAETIYVIPMIAFGNTAAPFVFQLLQYSTLVLLLGLVYAFLRERLGHSFLAFLGLFFVLALFDLEREVLHGGYTDVFVYLFGLGSLLLVVEYCATPAARVRRGLILSAILLGFALSVKQTALFIAPANALILFTAFVRRRMTFSQQLARLGAYGLIVVLIAGFWYAKNSYLFDSPLYAGGLTLSETIIVERTVPNMFLFPFYRFAIIGNKDSASRLIVLGYFVFIYAALAFFALFDRTKIKPEHLLLFAFSHLYLYLIFFISHHTRYFVPALVALPVLAALLIDRMYQYGAEVLGTRMHQKLLRVSLVCFQVLLVLLFIGNIRYFYVKFLYKTGVLTEQEYITEIGGL